MKTTARTIPAQRKKKSITLTRITRRVVQSLSHWPDKDLPFDHTQSEVLRALFADKEFCSWLMNYLSSKKYIAFDQEDQTWSAVVENT